MGENEINQSPKKNRSIASVRDYFETDYFSRDYRINRKVNFDESFSVPIKDENSNNEVTVNVRLKLNLNFAANAIYFFFYVEEFNQPVNIVQIGKFLIDTFGQKNPLHTTGITYAFDIVTRTNDVDRQWASERLINTRQMIIYIDADVAESNKEEIYSYGDKEGIFVKVRDRIYADLQSSLEKPLAFISHDSRDKDEIARPLVQELSKILGRVWFDEYSLRIGDNLRESIESGLRECRRCILILTPNFISNTGWAKTEFDSIFSRELIERSNIIIPVWAGITERDVYEFSPSLANRLAVNWNEGCEAVALKIRAAILD